MLAFIAAGLHLGSSQLPDSPDFVFQVPARTVALERLNAHKMLLIQLSISTYRANSVKCNEEIF